MFFFFKVLNLSECSSLKNNRCGNLYVLFNKNSLQKNFFLVMNCFKIIYICISFWYVYVNLIYLNISKKCLFLIFYLWICSYDSISIMVLVFYLIMTNFMIIKKLFLELRRLKRKNLRKEKVILIIFVCFLYSVYIL